MLNNYDYFYDFYNYYFLRDARRFNALKYACICVYKSSIFLIDFIKFFD